MEKNINSVYILTPSELNVIAAGKNIHGIFNLEEELLQMEETAVFQALSHLYEQQFIYNASKGGFYLNEDLEEMMTVISQAHTMLLIRSFIGKMQSKIIYIGKKLIAAERRETDINRIRLYEIPKEELGDFLKEDIQENEKQYKQVLDEERLTDAIMEHPSVLQSEAIDSLGNVIVMIERMNLKNGNVDCRMLIKQGRQQKKQICFKEGKRQINSFKKETFLDMVVNAVEEALYDIS